MILLAQLTIRLLGQCIGTPAARVAAASARLLTRCNTKQPEATGSFCKGVCKRISLMDHTASVTHNIFCIRPHSQRQTMTLHRTRGSGLGDGREAFWRSEAFWQAFGDTHLFVCSISLAQGACPARAIRLRCQARLPSRPSPTQLSTARLSMTCPERWVSQNCQICHTGMTQHWRLSLMRISIRRS